MQNKQKNNTFASVLPPVPESYRARMEDALAALPVDSARPVTTRGFTKKQIIILVAALITLLTLGTAAAVTISRMQEVRDRGLDQIENYTGMIYGTVEPEATMPVDPTDLDAYVPVAYGIGMNDKDGNWQPEAVEELGVSVKAGQFRVTLENLQYNNVEEKSALIAGIRIESQEDIRYSCSQFVLTVNDGEPIVDTGDLDYWQQAFELEKKNGGYGDFQDVFFRMSENPLRSNTTLQISAEINGEPFTLTYTLTAERFEELRGEIVQMLDNYAALLNDVPTEAIPVGAECNGYRVTEIALREHWLYFTVENIPSYWEQHDSREQAPYGKYDIDGFMSVIDGMPCRFEFISAKNGEGAHEKTQLMRSYLPYGDALPKESLVTLSGAPFRIEWATGKVTLPKDETEWLAWRQESEALSAQNGDYDACFIGKPEVKAETFTVSELVYINHDYALTGMIGVILETDEPVDNPFDGKDRQPVVTIAGAVCESETLDYEELDRFSGGTENDGRRVGFMLYGPAYRTLPETFDVTVTWNGNTTTFTMHKSDFARMYEEGSAVTFGNVYYRIFDL